MIPLGDPPIDDREIDAVEAALREGKLSTGSIVEEFEADVAEFADRAQATAVCSGSVALELALEGMDLQDGAGVIVSPYNCGAVLYSLLRQNLVPVFVDIDEATYGIDPKEVRRTIDHADVSVEGLLAVHLYGLPCEIDALEEIAGERDLVLVEDFAQAPGAEYDGRRVGSFGQVSVTSFGATKNLTTAEGGAVVGDDPELLDSVRRRRSNVGEPTEITPGSLRMNDLEAAIGREQLQKYDEVLDRKRAAVEVYDVELPSAVKTPPRLDDATHVFHGYPIRTADRDGLVGYLNDRGIGAAAVYDTPLTEYSQVAANETTAPEDYPATYRLADEVLLLPIHGSISTEDAQQVADAVIAYLE